MSSAQGTRIKSDFSTSSRIKRWVFLLTPTSISVYLFQKFINNDREQNSLEAAKFLVDTCNVYPTRYYRLIGKFLRFSFALGDVKLPKSYVDELIKILKKTRQKPSNRNTACDQMLKSTARLGSQQTSAKSWKVVSLALSGLGFIRASTIARNYCLAMALAEVASGMASDRTKNLALRGLLESRRFDEAREIIERHSLDPDFLTVNQACIYYFTLLNHRRPDVPILSPTIESEYLFSKLITGKTIALVAPGLINNEYGPEIDSYETVFRVKFLGFAVMPEEKFVGRRCDITSHDSDVLSLVKIDESFESRVIFEAPDLKLLVSKRIEMSKFGSTPVKPMRSWPPTFLTTGTSGTLALFDILCSSPKKVKLFGFNFYTTRQQYNSEVLGFYQSESFTRATSLPKNTFNFEYSQVGSSKIALSYISHDLKSDFLLVKNLYELSGLIDGTPEVLEILNLTADEYDARLEEMLGDW